MGADTGMTARETQESLQIRLRQREAEIEMLREVSDVIGGTYSLQKVFDLVAARARNLIDAETVTIPILTPDQSTYTYRAAVGEHADELRNVTLPLEIGVCGWVFRHRRPWWRGMLNQLDEHERNRWEKEAGTLILVPLVGKRQFLGGIAGINKKGGGEFDQRDLDLLTLFASQVSIAIENAMIFEELADAKQRAEAFREKLEETNQRLLHTNEELQHLALHDPLTRLPNRTLVTDRLQQGLLAAKRNEQPLALIMIDLDHFKEINDTLGHTIGDMLLISVGKRFQQVLREQDTLGRLGGDEFAVVLPQADRNDAIVVAQKLQAALQKPVTIEHNRFSIGASMGIVLYPEHGSDPSGLLKGADVAMYVAKRNRDEYAFYNVEHDKYNPDRLELLRDLRIAIHKQHIGLAFQPKLDMKSGTVTAIEALARWEHADKGRIPPSDFIPTLEQTGLIKPFTLYILEQAVTHCKSWQEKGFDISVAVNLSMHNLRDIKLAPHILEILRRYDFPASRLTLEITESAIMNDPEYSLDTLTELDSMGIELSVDDFGTGYSSLSYLKRLPVRQLKIDRSFVTDMVQDQDNAMIVHSTVDLAHNLGLRTVAEGVESADVLDALQKMGCDIAQGYFISRPLPPEELLKFLHEGRWPVPRIATHDRGVVKVPG